MKITIDTDILEGEKLSLGEFLVLLLGYCEVNVQKELSSLYEKKLVDKNLFEEVPPVLSDNTKTYISKLIVESDKNVQTSKIDYEGIAKKMKALYPRGNKEGTSYPWKDSDANIATKLRTLVRNYGFTFTEEEAIAATKEYVESFGEDKSRMRLLKYFILKTANDVEHNKGMSSEFMSIIENRREERKHEDNH